MKRFLLCPLLAFMLLSLSCADGIAFLSEREGEDGLLLNLPLQEGRLMNDAEFTLAFNICQAYRTKSVNFKGEYLNKTFNLALEGRNCHGDHSQYTLGVHFDGNDFFSPTEQPYIGGFETHEQGHLALLCQHLLKGEKLRNPAILSLSDSQNMEVTFTPGRAQGHYLIRVGKGKTFRYQVNLDHSSPMVGTNTQTTLRQSCDPSSGPLEYSELVQFLQGPN